MKKVIPLNERFLMKIFHLLTHTINAPKNESEGCKMEEDRYKRPDDDNQTISTPRAEDPIPGTFQVIDGNFQATDAEAESRSSIEAKHDYREETAAEIAAPQANRVNQSFDKTRNRTDEASRGGTLVGAISLILSILSLFMMPFLFGILGIIGGFISRRRGAKSLGTWAIGIGAISIIVGIFISPFF